MNILSTLRERGFIERTTDDDALQELLETPQTVYIGFDPTAHSLHIGSLIQIMTLSHFQRHGHRTIALVGGATGMIGDPSGKSEERQFLTEETLRHNQEGIRKQLARFLDFKGDRFAESTRMVNNLDWMKEMTYLKWLREVGKVFSVNVMVNKESVRRRFEDRDQGISYTEFSYMLLQAYDFLQLYEEYGCNVQAGGSDQWGNITSGIDLIRRKTGGQAYGITSILLTTSTGEKFGKSEGGNIWLDANLTSVWDFYQYFVRSSDADVIRYLKLLTFLSLEEIAKLEEEMAEDPGKRAAQKRLAWEITAIVHGEEQAEKMRKGAEALFAGNLEELDEELIYQVFSEGPTAEIEHERLEQGVSIIELAAESGLVPSKGEAKRKLKAGALYVNDRRVEEERDVTVADRLPSGVVILRMGKKKYLVLKVK